ncbi:uncharacterized protein BDW70DRAFT_126821 [Aspergillus foveolatus]|uniref:uncharacterized protein n=1 Tax=Aspergillus foveolatus TaxID=210207 RepID=UPI003CCD6137
MGRTPGIWILASGSVRAVGRKLWGVDSWLSFGVLISFRPFFPSSFHLVIKRIKNRDRKRQYYEAHCLSG